MPFQEAQDYFIDLPQIGQIGRDEHEKNKALALEIQSLKKEKDALILCHNYQRPEIHDVADHIGDSYGLCVAATKVQCKRIVFCGVRFMAETAYILNPDKTVLLPEEMAGCALADEMTAQDLRQWKRQYPDAKAVIYINCSAEVKAEADVICTSSNALSIVNKLDAQTILCGPDANLSHVIKAKSKKTIIPWEGYCPVHKAVTKEMLEKTVEMFPDAVVIVHPECNPDVVELADEVLSTSGMLKAIKERPEKKFIVGTELGLIQAAQKQNPNKEIHPIYRHKSCDQSCACPFMKVTHLESIVRSLKTDTHIITVPDDIRVKALKSVQRMLEMS